MPANRIQPRTWFVELRLSAAVSARDTPFESSSDADVRSCIKDILERSNYSRTIRGLQHVSFAYSVRDPTQLDLAGNQVQSIVDVIGFAHCNESILDTTMHSWIQDWRVMDQRWTPVYVTPGAGSNWMQADVIKNFFADCDRGLRVRVDWLWAGDASGSISKGGRPKRPRRGHDTGETSLPPPAMPAADIPPTPSTPVPIPLAPRPPPVIFSNFRLIFNLGDRRIDITLSLHTLVCASRPTPALRLRLRLSRTRTGSWLLGLRRRANTLRVRLFQERVLCHLQSRHFRGSKAAPAVWSSGVASLSLPLSGVSAIRN